MSRTIRLHLVALAAYLLLGLLIIHPLLFHHNTHVAGYDYFNYHWNFWWVRYATSHPDLHVYLNNYVMFPADANFGYHALSAFWYPLWAVVEPLTGTLTAMTLIVYIGVVLNGYLLFVFLRSAGAAASLALLGGIVIQAAPIARYSYFNTHINLMDWYWLPAQLLLWKQVVTAVAARDSRRALLWAVVQGVSFWGLMHTDLQFPIFTAFLLGPYGLWTLLRSGQRVRLVGFGVVAVAVGAVLLWFAGPLPYILQFDGQLVPGNLEDRTGIPLDGYLRVHDEWWFWHNQTVGGFPLLLLVATLAVSLLRAPVSQGRPGIGRTVSLTPERAPRTTPELQSFQASQPLPPQYDERWIWFLMLLPPLLISLGPTVTLGSWSFDLPFYRIIFALTDGNFRFPYRVAPIFVMATVIFAALTWTPLLPKRLPARMGLVVGLTLLLAVDVRLHEVGPVQPLLPDYDFHAVMAAETGDEYRDYVVVDAPSGAGTGEIIIGDPVATQLQWYGITHNKRTINGFISRAPINDFWYLRTDDPLLSWLGQRWHLDPERVREQLERRIDTYPIGYIVIHDHLIRQNDSTLPEIYGYLNQQNDLLCPFAIEPTGSAYRARWHPDGCPPRTPPEVEPGVYQIDIGSRDDARYIGWGWHWREDVSGLTLRWSGSHPQTDLFVDLPPADYTLEIAAQAFWEDRELRVRVNGEPLVGVADVAVGGLAVYTFDLPADLLGDGDYVTVTLDHDAVIVPAEVGQSADPRRLAVAVDWLRFASQLSDQ